MFILVMIMKHFKSVKVKKRRKFVRIVFTFFFFFSYVFMFKYCFKNKLKKSVLKNNINYVKPSLNNIISDKIGDVVNKPVMLLNWNVKNAKVNKVEIEKTSKSNNQTDDLEIIDKQNASKVSINEPLVYVYNTHQKEAYDNYSIYEASAYFSNKLNSNGIKTVFEEQSVSVFLEKNNLKYYKSYDVSKKFLSEAIQKYPSLKYFIDFHRDSVNKTRSTVSYNGKNYAKVLFLVGLENPSYSINLSNTEKLDSILKSKIPGISRGIMQKKGKGVNGVYNQDVSGNLFLIEVGAKDNNKDEVENTMNVIYDCVIQYMGGSI